MTATGKHILLPLSKQNRQKKPEILSVNVKDYKKLVPKDVYVQLKDCDASGKLKEEFNFSSSSKGYPLDLGMKRLYVHVIRCDEDEELKEDYFSASGRCSSNFKMNNV
ncbi:hypothetical protein TNIN_427251 [Trichonephila inaurata madagascariensis]|uniref:Uncharacterized protein n=1 Tax=Trichonephila inaurata madagascariensis TaxID=2747483 RepID=A0A8X6WWL8_9ARAC|nr:hypothetical protein TNIN_427251 [Trichonephila inaurata madagascariensis]